MKHIVLFLSILSFLFANDILYYEQVNISKGKDFKVYKKDTNESASGILKLFYDDNKTIKDIIPLKNGYIDGVYKLFYKDGKIKSKIDYKKSKRNGKHIVYFENGKKSYEADMKDEKKDGRVKEWYDNGQLKYDVLYKYNKVEGLVKIYDKNGSVQSINEYKDGKLYKQIKPKTPNNVLLQTRATIMYGRGKDVYYLFISPACPHCKDFIKDIKKYKDKVTFYIFVIPLNPKNKFERKMIDIIYSKKFSPERFKTLLDVENGKVDINQKISMEDLYYNNFKIMNAQQMQMQMGIRGVPALIDMKGFKYSTKEFKKKYK